MDVASVDCVPCSLHGAAVLLVWGTVDPRTIDEPALNDWWTNEHLPERLALPGFKRARRYFSKAPTGESKYLAFYEAEHPSDLRSKAYLDALNNPTAKTQQFMPCLAQLSRSACEVISSQCNTKSGKYARGLVGNCVALITFSQPVKGDLCKGDTGTRNHDRLPFATVLARPSILSLHILSEDEETTRIGSTSKSYESVQVHAHDRPTDLVKRIALIELSLPLGTGAVETGIVLSTFRSIVEERGGTCFTVETFDLLCAMDSHPRTK